LKLEYLAGEIFAFAHGTPTHADLGAATIAALVPALGPDCRVSTSDLITVVERTASGWTERDVHAGEEVVLEEPTCRFALDDIYRGIVLEEPKS